MNRQSARYSRLAVAQLLVWTSIGCSKPKQPSAEDMLAKLGENGGGSGSSGAARGGGCERVPIELFLQASPYLNQNAKGQSMPVQVKVFLLKDREGFEQLDFETLWHNAEEMLADDLVKTASVTVFPGKMKIHTMKSGAGVAYVALAGIFRRPQGRTWQYMVDVRTHNRCATKETLHTIVHALLKDNKLLSPDSDAALAAEAM